jgi:hypothetical protein
MVDCGERDCDGIKGLKRQIESCELCRTSEGKIPLTDYGSGVSKEEYKTGQEKPGVYQKK